MSTLATIDVTIPGNVEQIHLVASWLGNLRDDLWEAKDLLSNLTRDTLVGSGF